MSSWTEEDKTKATRYAEMTLAGCGVDDRMHEIAGDTAVHWRRETTASERDYVFKTNRGRVASINHQRGE